MPAAKLRQRMRHLLSHSWTKLVLRTWFLFDLIGLTDLRALLHHRSHSRCPRSWRVCLLSTEISYVRRCLLSGRVSPQYTALIVFNNETRSIFKKGCLVCFFLKRRRCEDAPFVDAALLLLLLLGDAITVSLRRQHPVPPPFPTLSSFSSLHTWFLRLSPTAQSPAPSVLVTLSSSLLTQKWRRLPVKSRPRVRDAMRGSPVMGFHWFTVSYSKALLLFELCTHNPVLTWVTMIKWSPFILVAEVAIEVVILLPKKLVWLKSVISSP